MLSARAIPRPAMSKAVPCSGLVRGKRKPSGDVYAGIEGVELLIGIRP